MKFPRGQFLFREFVGVLSFFMYSSGEGFIPTTVFQLLRCAFGAFHVVKLGFWGYHHVKLEGFENSLGS